MVGLEDVRLHAGWLVIDRPRQLRTRREGGRVVLEAQDPSGKRWQPVASGEVELASSWAAAPAALPPLADAEPTADRARVAGDVDAEHPDRALIGSRDAVDHAQRRRLAGPVGS